MRRTALLLACALMVVTALPAPAGPVHDEYWAISLFEVDSEREGFFHLYGALVIYVSDIGADPSIEGLILGAENCENYKEEDGDQAMRCRGSSITPLRESDRFEMAFDATSASLEARRKGHAHRLSWTATDEGPGLAGWTRVCRTGQGEGLGIARSARARGRLFDRKVESTRQYPRQFHMLAHGVAVTECLPWLSNAELDDLFDGGSISLRY